MVFVHSSPIWIYHLQKDENDMTEQRNKEECTMYNVGNGL